MKKKQTLLLHMLKTYINGLFKTGSHHQFDQHIYRVKKTELISITKIVYSYLYSFIDSVKFNDESLSQLDFSALKSLGNFYFYLS